MFTIGNLKFYDDETNKRSNFNDIDFILDHLIWVYNGDGLNRLGIGTAACVASRHSESHLAAEHFKNILSSSEDSCRPDPRAG